MRSRRPRRMSTSDGGLAATSGLTRFLRERGPRRSRAQQPARAQPASVRAVGFTASGCGDLVAGTAAGAASATGASATAGGIAAASLGRPPASPTPGEQPRRSPEPGVRVRRERARSPRGRRPAHRRPTPPSASGRRAQPPRSGSRWWSSGRATGCRARSARRGARPESPSGPRPGCLCSTLTWLQIPCLRAWPARSRRPTRGATCARAPP